MVDLHCIEKIYGLFNVIINDGKSMGNELIIVGNIFLLGPGGFLKFLKSLELS